MEEKKQNIFIAELKKFVGKEVEVTDIAMNQYKGICKAVSFTHLNVILMNERQKIVIKNIACIKRKRTFDKYAKQKK